jgi:three-Cys-motif partner protein
MPQKGITWECKPHTIAKHNILEAYLGAWFPILAKYNGRILYIDGYAGPGEYSKGEIGSPLIALKTAIKQQQYLTQSRVSFLFVEKELDRLQNLEGKISQITLPGNFDVETECGDFVKVIDEALDDLDRRGARNAPIFAFIDPFGFNSLPYTTVERLLNKDKTEVFIYFDRNSAIRFLTVDAVAGSWERLFGMSVPKLFEEHSDEIKRSELVKNAYYTQLGKAAKYVGYFTMMSPKNKPLYDLFFASNNPKGYVKMKEAMWRVDESGGFTFKYGKPSDQVSLFDREYINDVKSMMVQKYKGRKVSSEIVLKFIEEETVYLSKHMKEALRRLEADGSIIVDELKVDGSKRKKNSFPDGVKITF